MAGFCNAAYGEWQIVKEIEITPEIKKQLMQQFAPRVFPMKSENSGKEYLVAFSRNHITCTCRDWQYKSKDQDGFMRDPPHYCKHQKHLAYKLLKKGG